MKYSNKYIVYIWGDQLKIHLWELNLTIMSDFVKKKILNLS